jgi:hypothetical protein
LHPPTVYAKVIEVSRRVRWEIERDVIRGRRFDHGKKFMPSGLSLVHELPFLSAEDKRLLSQVQGRTYACSTTLRRPASATRWRR